MREFSCENPAACELSNICLALEANGVQTRNGEDSTCLVPAMIQTEKKGLGKNKASFEAVMKEGEQEGEIVAALGSEAIKILKEEASPSRLELIGKHEELLQARMDLWQAMLAAPKQHRDFTRQEKEHHEARTTSHYEAIRTKEVTNEDGILALAGFDSRCLDRHNLLFDSNMLTVMDRLVGNMMDGQPTLLVGDKGIAKTAAAKFASRLSDGGQEPLVISGHGDMGTNELIGEVGLENGKTVFKEGKIPQAAREGRVIILDEVNVSDVTVMLRLQDILLNIKPGKELVLQENGKEPIVVQPGFAVIATANEASKRYIHRQAADPANRDRYDIIRLEYPDMSGSKSSDILRRKMPNLRRLAYAAISDEKGNIRGISSGKVEELVALASATQYLYSKEPDSALKKVAGLGAETSDFMDDEPIMSDCITPRRLFTDLSRLIKGNKPGFDFDSVINSLIERLDEGDQEHNSRIARHLLSEIKKINPEK